MSGDWRRWHSCRPMRTRLICLGALACAAALAQPAAAQVQPAGTGEPLFTNSAQNTQFFEWPAQRRASTPTRSSTATTRTTPRSPPRPSTTARAPAARGPTGPAWRRSSTAASTASAPRARYSFPNDSLFFPDGPNSCSMGTMLGRRAHTTIDRSKPTAAITLAGGAAVHEATRRSPLKVDFSRRRRGPVPGQLPLLPVRRRPDRPLRQRPRASSTATTRPARCPRAAGKSTSFNCTADYGSGASPAPDGPMWACVRAADAAIPDNPRSSNQSASADKANLSDPACDGVVLDRTAPAASIGASATTVKVGDLVTFQARRRTRPPASAAQSAWTWGDNTAGGSGAAATHTFTQAGTYEVSLDRGRQRRQRGDGDEGRSRSRAPSGGGTTTPGGGTTTPGGGDDDAGRRRRPTRRRRHDDAAAAARRRRRRPTTDGRPATTPRPSSPIARAAQAQAAKAKAVRRRAHRRRRRPRPARAGPRRAHRLARRHRPSAPARTAYKLKLPKGTKAGTLHDQGDVHARRRRARRRPSRRDHAHRQGAAPRARRASRRRAAAPTVGRGPVGACRDGTFHGAPARRARSRCAEARPPGRPAPASPRAPAPIFTPPCRSASSARATWPRRSPAAGASPCCARDSGSGRAARAGRRSSAARRCPNREVAERADLVILAHKPAQLGGRGRRDRRRREGRRLDPRGRHAGRRARRLPGHAGVLRGAEHAGRGRPRRARVRRSPTHRSTRSCTPRCASASPASATWSRCPSG